MENSISASERERLATEYFNKGFNCCQSVIMAFADITGKTPSELAVIASGFGGGMGRMREVCGAFSGMVMAAGFISPADNPSNLEARKNNYALVREFAAAFRELNGGSIICRELLGIGKDCTESPAPSVRNAEFYHKRPCAAIVGTAARIIAAKIQTKG